MIFWVFFLSTSLLFSVIPANSDYDPNNSVNINDIKKSFMTDSEPGYANPSIYASSNDLQTSETMLQGNSNYDPYNSVNFNDVNDSLSDQFKSSQSTSLTLESFMATQARFNQAQTELAPMASTDEIKMSDYNSKESVKSHLIYTQFIPKHLPSKQAPSIQTSSPSSDTIKYDLTFDNAEIYDQKESVDVTELKPFYKKNK
tara:strand:- start:1823 stop:2425 length:603 start_codon:yes stop_codon:yes gene_type:complete